MENNTQFFQIISHLYHLLIAFLLALPIGWERERGAKSAGLRTFPLVAVTSCGYMLLGLYVLDSDDSRSRVMYGIITGIGFIGGGAIIKSLKTVSGTATAASLWNTGAIGMAVAWNRYEIAVILALLNYLTLRYATYIKNRFSSPDSDREQKPLS